MADICSVISPLVWGDKSIEIYKKRGQFGATLNRTSADQAILVFWVLEFLDGLRMWKTVLNHSRPLKGAEQGDVSNLYDVRFLLRLFLSLMQAGSEVTLHSSTIPTIL
ncbi:hypothetical protein ANCCAN_11599 [Ancylostoma caninum]|uniref:Uncharacterized protein n=1 Tax=Ancylostoma caninum TaxID=29170 RepID=A0A368GGR6_ANCCA|nr:hypothetical protein ANCCAN_11599 [Ancylostoma caninum]